jgi:predicted site-specific integrase-resolvase
MDDNKKTEKPRKDKIKKFISIGEASDISGLDPQTIRKFIDAKEITGFKTPSGHRRVCRESLQQMLSDGMDDESLKSCERKNFLYARVSTKKQMDDLSRQISFLQRPEYDSYNLITDIGSGINFKRKGLQSLLDHCIQGNIGEIVIAYRDRLCRFGFELLESLITKAGGKITVLGSNDEEIDEAKELTEDLLAIITIFSCRQMGKRSYQNKKRQQVKNSADKTLPDKVSNPE